MYRRVIKREKPTLKTAHEFFRVGSYSVGPEHWLSKEERDSEIQSVLDSLHQAVRRNFPRTQNLEYAVLKSHLIIEFAITQYIRCFTSVMVPEGELRFSFSQKLEIAYLMGLGVHDPIFLPTVQIINRVRNQVAHSFNLDRVTLDEAFRINSDEYDDFSLSNDRERIRFLRWICDATCGRIAGQVFAHYTLDRSTEADGANA